jgi:hypothetical protein
MHNQFGITERGDAGLNQSWLSRAKDFTGIIAITKSPQLIPLSLPDNVIVHCNITGLGGSYVEPGVKPPDVTLPAYRKLIAAIGSERCVLRVDPIIPTERGMKTALDVIAQRLGRVRISYIDNYKNLGFKLPWNTFHAPNRPILPDVEVCAEPGMPCTGCVSLRDFQAIGLPLPMRADRKGQRPLCPCLAAKTELLNEKKPCAHGCLYCYWRT